jgi:hypothetical protein
MGTRATARIAPTFIAISAEVVCGASRSLPCGYAAPYVPYFRPPSFGVDPARGPKFRVAVPGSRFTLFALADRCPISPSLYPPQAALRFDSPYGGAHKRGFQRVNIAAHRPLSYYQFRELVMRNPPLASFLSRATRFLSYAGKKWGRCPFDARYLSRQLPAYLGVF